MNAEISDRLLQINTVFYQNFGPAFAATRRRIQGDGNALTGTGAGRVPVSVCVGTSCYLRGSQKLLQELLDGNMQIVADRKLVLIVHDGKAVDAVTGNAVSPLPGYRMASPLLPPGGSLNSKRATKSVNSSLV